MGLLGEVGLQFVVLELGMEVVNSDDVLLVAILLFANLLVKLIYTGLERLGV